MSSTIRYTRVQLAQIIGVSERTLKNWHHKGYLHPGHGYGRWTSYDNSHVRRALQLKHLFRDHPITGSGILEHLERYGTLDHLIVGSR